VTSTHYIKNRLYDGRTVHGSPGQCLIVRYPIVRYPNKPKTIGLIYLQGLP